MQGKQPEPVASGDAPDGNSQDIVIIDLETDDLVRVAVRVFVSLMAIVRSLCDDVAQMEVVDGQVDMIKE